MGRPLGSKNKPKQTAMQTDGYAECFTGLGTRADRSTGTRAQWARVLCEPELINLYISDGIAKRIVDLPSKEATRAGFTIEELDESLADDIYAKWEDLDLNAHLTRALQWRGVFGGAVLVLGINDGGTLDVPLNENGVKDLEFVRVYDRYQATIQTRNFDPMSIDYGKPEMWLISPKAGGHPYTVHTSRIIVIDGETVPDQIRESNDGWGASTYQSCLDQLTRLGTSHQWANALLERAQQAVHKITNLASTLREPGGEQLVRKRVDLVDMVRGILNTIVIDGNEDYSVSNMGIGPGVTDLLDRFAEALSAVTGIPVFLLMGRSSGGLNASSKENMDGWYALVECLQNDVLRKPIVRLVSLILASKGNFDHGWKIEFNPLSVPTDKEKAEKENIEAETDKIKSDAISAYVNIGAMSQDEARKQIMEDYDLDDVTLKPEDVVE